MTVNLSGKFRLYIDESGTHQLARKNPEYDRFLGLLGCVVNCASYRTEFLPALNRIKSQTFGDDPDSPVVLHREDILKHAGPFVVLKDSKNRDRFNREIVSFCRNQEYVVIAVVLDKTKHAAKYGRKAYNPYEYCFTVLAERFCFFLEDGKGTGANGTNRGPKRRWVFGL